MTESRSIASDRAAVDLRGYAGEVFQALGTVIGLERIHRDYPLALLTTLRVGGPAEWFVDVRGEQELIGVLCAAESIGLEVTMLGGGSNVLVSDAGVRGLVVRARHGTMTRTSVGHVRVSAGLTLNEAIRWMIRRGLGGLEAWAGTPGTVGGAVYGDAHFGGRVISELITSVAIAEKNGRTSVVPREAIKFGPENNPFERNNEVIQWVEFSVVEEASCALRAEARASLSFRKKTQPLNMPSAGCAFRNPEGTSNNRSFGVPCSAGALIDGTGLKGQSYGGARVSERHGNFIVTRSDALASDVLALIKLCRKEVASRYDIVLVPEIVFLGEFS